VHLGAKRQSPLACGLVQLAYRISITIDGEGRQTMRGQPQRVTPASAGNIERTSLARQQTSMLDEP
jgi:hypothetical protein